MVELAEVKSKAEAGEVITINGKAVDFSPSETILEVARRSGTYIPTLCARADLPTTGSCRLCIVKVEGMKGYVTSCTTPAEPNMVVVTNSPEIEKLRRGILELILSEHPSACLVCPIRDTCDQFNAAPSKAGRVTGCNTCSKRDTCELRQLAEYLGLTDIRYPFHYKGFPLERDDPFMDRDYNLCILCGRCISVCQEYLGQSAISFVGRGHDTKVGTSFGKLHVEGNCVFCMHCVDVCPTGALTVRGSKWYGNPDKETVTTCILCDRGCELVIDAKWNKVVGARPSGVDACAREYCVKGRCCLPALCNNPERLKFPAIRREDGAMIYTDWEKAIRKVVDTLSRHQPAERAVLCSRHLSDESIYAFGEFARVYAESHLYYVGDRGVLLSSQESQDEEKMFAGIKVLYVTEANSVTSEILEKFSNLEHIIIQDIYPSPLRESAQVCAELPAAVFTEMDGTKTTANNHKRTITKAADPPGYAKPDWEIVLMIGSALQDPGFTITDYRSLQINVQKQPWVISSAPLVSKDSLTYRGFSIADFVPDFKRFVERRIQTKGKVHF